MKMCRAADWAEKGLVIPQNIIDKPPSAELRPDQKDEDSLPPYDALDDILFALVEDELGVDEIIARGHDAETVKRIEHLLYVSEYKRRQAAPGAKIGMSFRTRPPLSDYQWLPRRAPEFRGIL